MLPYEENKKKADSIDQDLLRKYIIYARKHVQPKLNEINQEKVTQFYAEMRRESQIVGGIPIAVRHIESILRMAEAHAKMHLREHVRGDDIDIAIEMMLNSFIQTQKYSIARQMNRKFESYRMKKNDSHQLILNNLNKMIGDKQLLMRQMGSMNEKIEVSRHQFESDAKDL